MWVINGQKVWTSGGQIADMGMLIARTNPTAPKHQGITWFAFDMHQPGVRGPSAQGDDRPRHVQRGLPHRRHRRRRRPHRRRQRRLVGRQHDAAVRAVGHGRGRRPRRWARRPARSPATSTSAAGDFVRSRPVTATKEKKPKAHGRRTRRPRPPTSSSPATSARTTTRRCASASRRAHILGELTRLNTERHKAVRAQGGDIPGLANFSKLLMADILRHNRDMSGDIMGARGMLHAYTDERPRVARASARRFRRGRR